MANHTKGKAESYDWRSDLAFIVARVPVLANVNAPANRLLEHFDRLERKAADAVGAVERVKDAVGKSQTRKRVIRVESYSSEHHAFVVDASDAAWLEELADAAMKLRTVRLTLRAVSLEGEYAVVDVERDLRKPLTDEAEPGDWVLEVQTLHYDCIPGRAGAELTVRTVGERKIAPLESSSLGLETVREMERIDAAVDRTVREAFLTTPSLATVEALAAEGFSIKKETP